ncbi:MAG: 2-C-methyl-D-erythritol 2,4-cyclodiphosphate synthase [Thermodesulfobacteriota bacterium]
MRIGHGFDAHRFAEGRKLILSGVEIDHPRGLDGHSDADVLIHAVIDALLGAAGLGDIGMHFPDSDPELKGASSLNMLEIIAAAIQGLGMRISNVDVTLMAQEPRIGPHRPAMEWNLAECMGVEHWRVNIKATTTEGLGFVGRAEGIAAAAVALLEENPPGD